MTLPTYAQAQQLLRQQLAGAGIDSAPSEAQQLLSDVLGLSRVALMTRANEPLSAEQWDTLQALAQRRAAREPLQHLLGWVDWADLRLEVSPDALIPRPETEVLLELACQQLAALHLKAPRVLDVGTGTGALALGIKQRFLQAQVTASDISPQALNLARRNAQHNGLEVNFILSDMLSNLTGPFDLLVSNPPYLPQSDAATIQPEVRYDPALALYSGADGLDLARQLCQQAPRVLRSGAPLLLELDPRNAPQLVTELLGVGAQAQLHADLTGRQRFVIARFSELP